MSEDREKLARQWFTLTREDLPALAVARGWPVHLDHCFQRILLDNAVGGPWRETIAPPAWRHVSDAHLARAIELGRMAKEGEIDLALLNRKSLLWRGKLR